VVLCSATADCPLPGVLIGQEGERWVITLGGYGADVPPLDRAGFVQRAQQMAPEIAAVANAGRFVSEPARYRFPHSQRRRYERLRQWPLGLLAMGDAVCSFNPIYGQGMTVAACEALALRDALASDQADPARHFFKAAARIVDVAWTTAVGADLAIPSVEGKRPLPVRIVNAYVARVFRAAQHDPVVALAFLEVAHLLAQPPSLMRPAMLWRVLRAGWRRAGDRMAATAAPARPVVSSGA
jgi:2-polyprenyl-6-methoxyphenol hydroxylase-like FAD-dependent oxidoreductase